MSVLTMETIREAQRLLKTFGPSPASRVVINPDHPVEFSHMERRKRKGRLARWLSRWLKGSPIWVEVPVYKDASPMLVKGTIYCSPRQAEEILRHGRT